METDSIARSGTELSVVMVIAKKATMERPAISSRS